MEGLLLVHGCAVVVAAIAAATDWRTGKIPNWLTLPAIVLAPLLYGWFQGSKGFLESLIGIVVCGAVPWLMFKMPMQQAKDDGKKAKPMHGGDVKLLAALGGILTLWHGIPAQFYAFFFTALFTLGALAWRGRLFRTFGNIFIITTNPFRAKDRKKKLSPDLMTQVRLGPGILAGVVFEVILSNPYFARFG